LEPGKRALRSAALQRPYDLVVNLECGSECDDFVRFVPHHRFCGRPLANPGHSLTRHCVDTEKSIYEDLLGAARVSQAQPGLRVDTASLPQDAGAETPFVMLNPGFAGLGRTGYRAYRGWPIGHWVELAERIRTETRWGVAVNGTAAEAGPLAALLGLPQVRSLVGTSLEQLVSATRAADAVVSVDTGTMHLAAALGRPVVALFGPTIPALTGPYSHSTAVRVLSSGLACQPCDRTPALKRCKANRCMDELPPAAVVAALRTVAEE
jgi:ADP-heptose:LPS heptosyltransferase